MGQTVVIEDDRKSEVADDFVIVYEAHYPRLVRALQIGGLDRTSAEDVAQEAFARTLGHWRRVRLGTNPPGYVYRTAFRLSRSHWKQENMPEVERPSRDDTAAEAVSRLGLEDALARMPARRRACAMLCFVVGLSPKEAARSLGIAEGTVRKQLGLARDDLKPLLEESPPAC
ncbi:MAG: sigma-70 family RNA polymerase sigma factor [Acidimicrobiales bacterium]